MSGHIRPNTAETIWSPIVVDSTGTRLTGLTDIFLRIVRSDGLFYDWSDSTFKAFASVVDPDEQMTQVSATGMAGLYSAVWPGGAAGQYVAEIRQDPVDDADNLPALVELRVGQAASPGDAMDLVADAVDSTAVAASAVTEFQSGLATATALADVQSDTNDIQGRLPAALVSGRIDASVGAMAANVVTAAAIATDAIDADALAASAVTEIQSGLATSSAVAGVQTDVDDIQTRLPAALVGGRIDASVGAMASGVVTAAAIATDAIDSDAIAASAVTELQSGLATSAAVAAIPAAVDTQLSGTHGGSSWATATGFSTHSAADVWAVGTRTLTGIGSSGIASQTSVDALPTAVEIDTQLSGTHGGGSWATATGFAVPGDAMALTPTERTIVQALILSDATPFPGARIDVATSSRATNAGVWATAEGTPSAGTMAYAQVMFRKWLTNRNEVSTVSNGREILYDDDATTPLLTWTLRDGSGGPITTPDGSPARRGAAT